MGYPVSPAVMVRPLGAPRNNSDNNSVVDDIAIDDNDRSDSEDQDNDSDDNDPDDNGNDDNITFAPNVAEDVIAYPTSVDTSSFVRESVPKPISPVRDIPAKIRRFRSRTPSHRPLTFTCSSVKEIIESVHSVRSHPGQELEWDIMAYDMENFDPEVHLFNPLTPTRDRPTVSVSITEPVITAAFVVPPAQSVAVSHPPVSPGVGVGRGVARESTRPPFSMRVSHHQPGLTPHGLTSQGLTVLLSHRSRSHRSPWVSLPHSLSPTLCLTVSSS